MALKPQDVLVLLKIALQPQDESWTYDSLAKQLSMSAAEVHAATKRAAAAGLMEASTRRLNRTALMELIEHGLKYVFAPERGGITRGIPTAHGASPLKEHLAAEPNDILPVWPSPKGTVRGESLSPLYKSAPAAAARDPKLYECLALVDAIRAGRARDRKLAMSMLAERLRS